MSESAERDRRLYHQGIVYGICEQLDHVFSEPTLLGECDDLSSLVSEKVARLVREHQAMKAAIYRLVDDCVPFNAFDHDELNAIIKEMQSSE